jgi:cysteine-rich repeat protein
VACGDGTLNVSAGEACDDGNVDNGDGCSDACVMEGCGDGVVNGMEECDDANDVETDECISTCLAASCGDGYTWEGTEECDDANEVNTDDCTDTCQAPVCGDGYVWEGNEDCEDGNDIDTDECIACVAAVCGDGFVWAGNEECDDGNDIDDDDCTNACESTSKLVFSAGTVHDGNFGGLTGADAWCQGLADDAGLGGTFMAWLSDDTGSPSTRFTQATTPYKLVDGTIVADNWADLTDGSLDNPIDLDESGAAPPSGYVGICGYTSTVWSNTTVSGTLLGANNDCGSWTGSGGSAWSRWTHTDATWTAWCSGGACTGAWVTSLYCFQQ